MTELLYTESKRELVESQPIRREIDGRREGGIEVVIYWVKKSNLVLLSLTELGANRGVEFAIPNDKVLDAKKSPYSYMYGAEHGNA